MACAGVTFAREDVPVAKVMPMLTTPENRYITITVGSVYIYLPDYNADAAKYARALAATLTEAADKLDPPAPPPSDLDERDNFWNRNGAS